MEGRYVSDNGNDNYKPSKNNAISPTLEGESVLTSYDGTGYVISEPEPEPQKYEEIEITIDGQKITIKELEELPVSDLRNLRLAVVSRPPGGGMLGVVPAMVLVNTIDILILKKSIQ
jgi:hypothetical protein